MKNDKKKGVIAILTGGGDVPGLNPAIRANIEDTQDKLFSSSFTYRHPEAAMKFAEYAFKKDPENSGFINTYARLLYCLGDLEDALTWQEKAVKLDPNNKTYQDNLNYYISIKTLRPGNKKN